MSLIETFLLNNLKRSLEILLRSSMTTSTTLLKSGSERINSLLSVELRLMLPNPSSLVSRVFSKLTISTFPTNVMMFSMNYSSPTSSFRKNSTNSLMLMLVSSHNSMKLQRLSSLHTTLRVLLTLKLKSLLLLQKQSRLKIHRLLMTNCHNFTKHTLSTVLQ